MDTHIKLKLYIMGKNSRSQQTIADLKAICETEFKNPCEISVIDILEHPQVAKDEKVLITPMVVREHPKPAKRLFGDLSDKKKVLLGLGIATTPGELP